MAISDTIYDFVNGNIPEVLMIVAGLMALVIVGYYRKDKDGSTYKFTVLVGFILGIVIMYVAASRVSSWTTFDAVLILVAGFALFIRPLTKVDFVILFALLVMGIVYIYLGTLTGDLAGLSEGYPRIIIAFIAGSFVYMVFHFAEKIMQLVGQFLNCWPVLFVLGLICLAEGALMFADCDSIFTIVQKYIQ